MAKTEDHEPEYQNGNDPMDVSDHNESQDGDEMDGDGVGTTSRKALNTARNQDFESKRNLLNKAKSADSAKRFAFLLGQTELFRHFIDVRAQQDAEFAQQMAEAEKRRESARSKSKSKLSDRRHRKTEQEEDMELMNDEAADEEERTVFTESPFFIDGELRDYQIQGLNWLISLYENGISGILADEMGLGKTLQTIAFLGYLKTIRDVSGPHLVTVPKSTVDNWAREFAKWCPEFNILVMQGNKEERASLVQQRLLTQDFDVCITSYELVLRERTYFKKFAWEYVIVDEAHRIKNEESMLSQVVRLLTSRNRLLITGTPLQNNMHELWALLNFLLPDVFNDSAAFDQWFQHQGDGDGNSDTVIQQLHKVLRPFLLRRVKADVEKSLKPKKEINLYVGMSEMQIKWYQKILEKDIEAVNGMTGKREGKTRLLNIVMQLRKCCNHPYLFDGAEPGPPYTNDEHIVQNAGKMILLDKLLKRMQAQGSRVLIFSQMSRVLDILEDYCFMREYEYCRIDGQTPHEDRISAIDEYNKPDSSKFIFLLTTRAGGLGINLTSADIVVLYDSDWNPQADLQAMDRAHRIGQTKQVYVFRFITEKAIEEKVLERAAHKLRLDQLVIQQGRSQQKKESAGNSKDDLLGMIQHGAEGIFQQSGSGTVADADFDEIFRQGEEKTQKLNKRYENLGLDDLQKFTSDSAYEWDGKDYTKKKETSFGMRWINPAKRERGTQQYSIDKAYQGVFKSANKAEVKAKAPKPPKQVHIQDHQFYPQRLIDLQDRETAHFRKEQGYKVPLADDESVDLETREADRDLEQDEIDNAEPLTEEAKEEKNKLVTQGFSDWSRRSFLDFIHACARYGRDQYEEIAQDVEGKTAEEIKTYADVFWERYREIEGYDRYINMIESGEHKIEKQSLQAKLLNEKISSYRAPIQQLKFTYYQNKGRLFSEDEDRFLAVKLNQYGIDRDDTYERIREDIRESPLFRFDWFIKSRTAIEIQRRCQTLLTCITKELTDNQQNGRRQNADDTEDEEPPRKKTGASMARGRGRGRGKQPGSSNVSRSSTPLSSASKGKSKTKK